MHVVFHVCWIILRNPRLYAAVIALKSLELYTGEVEHDLMDVLKFMKSHQTKLYFQGTLKARQTCRQQIFQNYGQYMFTPGRKRGSIKLIDPNFDPWDLKHQIPTCETTPAQRIAMQLFCMDKPPDWKSEEHETDILVLSQKIGLDVNKVKTYIKNHLQKMWPLAEKNQVCSVCLQKKQRIEYLKEENEKMRLELKSIGLEPTV